MCRAVTCRKCGKTTWAGCGQHVSQVMAGVPAAQRCAGHASDPAASGGWLRKLFGQPGLRAGLDDVVDLDR